MSILLRPAAVLSRRPPNCIAVSVALVCFSLSACEQAAPPQQSAILTVKRLPPTQNVTIDASLEEWGDGFIVAEVAPAEASAQQWRRIRGNSPAGLGSNDFGMRVQMTHDASAWYIGVEVRDDAVVSVERDSAYPYSGDCLEVFFAGSDLNSEGDFHDHVETPRTPNQRAFFQLVVPPVNLADRSVHVPAWRTDSALRRHLLDASDFAVAVIRTRVGWNSEVRIPFSAFDESVSGQIRGQSPLRVNIDYLDYDSELASREEQPHYGFKPDNVFCRCADEDDVNVPRNMQAIVFEQQP